MLTTGQMESGAPANVILITMASFAAAYIRLLRF
jgi:hypothetical protein